jgi:hypothetical protein
MARLEVMIEQFLNPNNIGAIRLVASAVNQSFDSGDEDRCTS